MQRHQILKIVPGEILLLVVFVALLQLGFFPNGLEVALGTIERLLGTTAGLLVNP